MNKGEVFYMFTIEEILEMKNQPMSPFSNKYKWLFEQIENELVSKSNGEYRVKEFLKNYDEKAKLYIVHQFFNVNIEIGNQLIEILEIKSDNTFLEEKYVNELLDREQLYKLI